MEWRLKLEPRLAVETDAGSLGAPPNASVAVLLVLLAARREAPLFRPELAARLYPESSRTDGLNALRQSLHRLRGWLGPGCVATEEGGIRLTPGRWTVTPDPLRGDKLESVLLAGVDHPELDRIRRDWCGPAPLSLDATVQAFVAVVKGLADHDVDASRAIFVSGGPLLGRLGNENYAELLRRTKPTNRQAPFALEHRERTALFFTHLAEFERSRDCFLDVYRLASRTGNDAIRMRAASYAVCSAIEMGEMAEAQAWLGKLDAGRSRGNLDLMNAQACFYWNAGDPKRAMGLMDEARRFLAGMDVTSRFRFWVNDAFLSAEAGELERLADALAQASELGEPEGAEPNTNLEIARALGWAKRGEPYHAIDRLSRSLRRTQERGRRAETLYVEESLAGLFAEVGNVREAKRIWGLAQAKRGGRPIPRLSARHRTIERLSI